MAAAKAALKVRAAAGTNLLDAPSATANERTVCPRLFRKGQLAPGTPVWARPGAATEEWVEAEVVSEDGADQVTVQLVADQVQWRTGAPAHRQWRGPTDPFRANAAGRSATAQKTVAVPRARVKAMDVSSHKGVDDMTKLADLFEGSLLRNLRLRFQADQIYVRCRCRCRTRRAPA